MENDDFFVIDLDFDEVGFRDRADHQIDPNFIKADGVQFRISAEAIEQMLNVAKHYATMREMTSDIEVTWGAPIIEDGNTIGYADGIPSYRFTTAPCFTNVESILIDGKHAGFEPFFTDVVIWDGGRGITFICHGNDGMELVYGGGKHDFELFLQARQERLAAAAPTAGR